MTGMRAFRSVLVSVIILVLLRAAPAYPWHGTGSIAALAIDPRTPSTLYAGTCDRGVFKRVITNGVESWSATDLTNTFVFALAIDPQTPTTLYAGAAAFDCVGAAIPGTFNGVYKSTDGGVTWSATGLNIAAGPLIDPQIPTTLYAVTSSGVLKSTDGGDTWSVILLNDWLAPNFDPPYGSTVASPVIAPRTDPNAPATLYAGVTHVSPEMIWGYVLKSTDGGATWGWSNGESWGEVPWDSGPGLAIDPQTPTTLYGWTEGLGVLKSTDGGVTWSATGLNNIVHTLAIDPQTPTTLYAGTTVGVFKSTDGGVTWSAVNTGLTDTLLAFGVRPSVGSLAIDPVTPNTLYAGTAIGVFKSTDSGAFWSPTVLFQHSPLSSVSLNPTSVTAGATSTGTVALMMPAPAGGAAVTLSSSDPTVATVPASVTVTAGATSAEFTVSTSPVGGWVAISAAFDDAIRHAVLTVTPPATLSSVSLNPTSVTGGTASTGTVTLSAAAPADGAAVTLSSSDPAVATVPASVTVAAGATSANFTVSTSSVAASTAVTISGTYGGVTRSAGLTVTPPDTEPPDTSITSAVDGNGASVPPGGTTVSNAITVAFTGTDNVAVARFECRLDGASFTSCTSPVTYSGLAVGRHDFEVRAVDTSDNRDGTPALHTWTVDSPPETTITSAVDGRGNPIPNGGATRSNKITFSFTGTDNGSVTGFECSLDGAAFTACTSPITYERVSRGTHTFQVRAIDNNGFRDPTPATFTWTRS